MASELARRLLDWYHRNARSLPWRERPDPYAVWVSEIMLQQTRVETVIPYFERWMSRFPSLVDLANASQQEVLSTWEGLGYYSRARNLQRAAQKIVAEYSGQVPSNVRHLRELPGVGRYTAGAIASIAFGLDEPALDGNIRRVFSRVFDLRLPARSPEGERILWDLVTEHLPPGQAGDYNQAIMDLGAAICTPRKPACPICPLEDLCQARMLGVQEERPIRTARPEIPHYTVTAAILTQQGRILITRRPEAGLLGGLWEFPGGKVEQGESLIACLQREISEELGVLIEVGDLFGIYQHTYTHFRVTLHAFHCRVLSGEPQPLHASALAWILPEELIDYPMGKIDRSIATQIVNNSP